MPLCGALTRTLNGGWSCRPGGVPLATTHRPWHIDATTVAAAWNAASCGLIAGTSRRLTPSRASAATSSISNASAQMSTARVVVDPAAIEIPVTGGNPSGSGRSRSVVTCRIRVRAVDYELGSVAGAALYADGYRGHARMVVDEDRRVVVGATFVGSGAGELLHAATVAVVGEIPLDRLWHAVPSYPTLSEVWLRLLEAYGL